MILRLPIVPFLSLVSPFLDLSESKVLSLPPLSIGQSRKIAAMILLVLATNIGVLRMYREVNGLTMPSQHCCNKGSHQKQNERMHLPVQMHLHQGLYTLCVMPCLCLADASQAWMTPQTQMCKFGVISGNLQLLINGNLQL